MEQIEYSNKLHDKINEMLQKFFLPVGSSVQSLLESQRFPYTYAYDYERLGTDNSRGSTSEYLSNKHFPNYEEHAKDILRRALSYIYNYHPEAFLNDILNADIQDRDEVIKNYQRIKDNIIKS